MRNFQIWSFLQSKSVNNVCKLLQIQSPRHPTAATLPPYHFWSQDLLSRGSAQYKFLSSLLAATLDEYNASSGCRSAAVVNSHQSLEAYVNLAIPSAQQIWRCKWQCSFYKAVSGIISLHECLRFATNAVVITEIKPKQNCFVSFLFQFHFTCNHC